MYPEQPPQQPYSQPPQPSNDGSYLDQIATPTPVKTVSPLLLWGGIGGLLLLIVGIFFVVSASSGLSRPELFTSYVHRVQALAKLTKDSSKTINSSDLRALSASTTSILGTADQEAEAVSGAYQLKKIPEPGKSSKVTAEFTTLDEKLNDARLNAIYDRTYSREIGFQLAKIRSEMSVLYESAKSSELREYYEKTDANLQPLVKQFTDFNDSEG